jgi:hypothetical protein
LVSAITLPKMSWIKCVVAAGLTRDRIASCSRPLYE